MTVVFAADGQVNPAQGVLGGAAGNIGEMHITDADGNEVGADAAACTVRLYN